MSSLSFCNNSSQFKLIKSHVECIYKLTFTKKNNARFASIQSKQKEKKEYLSVEVDIFYYIFIFLGHFAHKECVSKYNASENARNSSYLCPMRCPRRGV